MAKSRGEGRVGGLRGGQDVIGSRGKRVVALRREGEGDLVSGRVPTGQRVPRTSQRGSSGTGFAEFFSRADPPPTAAFRLGSAATSCILYKVLVLLPPNDAPPQ